MADTKPDELPVVSLPLRLRALAGEPWPFDVPDPDFGIVGKTMREAADRLDEYANDKPLTKALNDLREATALIASLQAKLEAAEQQVQELRESRDSWIVLAEKVLQGKAADEELARIDVAINAARKGEAA